MKLDERIVFPERNHDILTVGELLIDMISDEYEPGLEKLGYHSYFGGSPSNIAMNVKKLGIRPFVCSAVGRDRLGEFLISRLQEAGIDTRCIQQVDYATSMVVVNKSASTPVPIFYREADYHLAYTRELEEILSDSKIIHFSCWPISRMPVRQTIQRVIAKARELGVLVCFDPNYHPMIWEKDEDGMSVVKPFISMADIVKPSEDDAGRLFGPDTPENQIAKFLTLGAKLVILTLGKDGALISNGSETLRVPSMATEVVDTTGAGDAFWSGFYAGIVKGFTIRQALAAGFAVSAYKLQYTGAVVGLPPLEELQVMYGLKEANA